LDNLQQYFRIHRMCCRTCDDAASRVVALTDPLGKRTTVYNPAGEALPPLLGQRPISGGGEQQQQAL
jgi:hypothetical protein